MIPTNIILGWIVLTTVQTYNQNDFRLILDHWEFHGYNKMYLNYLYVKNVKPNRTTKALDLRGSTKYDFTGNTLKIYIQGFQFYHNEYRRTPIVFDIKICEVLEQKLFGIEQLMTTNGNITKCPLKKGVYYISNFNFDDSAWPPHVPRGKYQIKITFKKSNVFLGAISWFGSVEDVLKY